MKNITFLLFFIIISCVDKPISDENIKNNYYDKAFDYRDKGVTDSSFLYFYKAKDFFLTKKDSFGAGKCIINMAIILTEKNDHFGAQEMSLDAIKFFKKDVKEHQHYLGTNFNNLGIDSYNLKDYNNAITFYNQAIFFADNIIDKNIYLNNKANAYREIKQYENAIKIYNSILKNAKQNNSDLARTITNLAKTHWLQNPSYNPTREFRKALEIRLKEKDNWGLNSSFSHLADYYIKTQPDSALYYAKKMYDTSIIIKSPDDKIEALQKLISLEDNLNAKKYFLIYQKLNDSLLTVRNKAKNQFALIRYETEKNKTDFLKAKAESAERKNHIIMQYIIIGIVISALLLSLIWFSRRQKRLQQEKLLEIKKTELNFSKKVHDKVANRIYQIMSLVENKEMIDKDALLFGLENAYETSRDISYDKKEINENQNFTEQLHKMLDSYSSDTVKIIFNGNQEKLWDGVSFQNKTEAYLILQELLTNMKKHSRANIVSVVFSKENTNINISYTDNGIGMKNFSAKNGIQNMENRINSINGTIIFDTENNNLLKINITFPI